jgi:sphingomyelin phosphodiesterase
MKKKYILLDINLLHLVLQHSVEIMFELLIGKDLDTHSLLFRLFFYRYENTIAGQFFGHAHSEELKVFYDEVDTKRPVSMVCISVYLPHL